MLRWIAQDYLAIQGLATPSERAFSSGGITGCAQRNRLQPAFFEGLQLLKSAYQNGHVSVGTQVVHHMKEAMFTRSLADSGDEIDYNYI